ncbi:Helicase associated domain protein [Parabacteroides faecis]|uniref:Helicase associated domain protein n=1 Tax=Parabacteroides faecis TaxID=1217282 RepID=UPI0021641AD8|nr:Helicase associated domain protein [Parabacteroides faecis]MCS2892470.1 Helicase associated domain protein [Parabacteroides faecis]UVQ48892.1 Helicase associated domain protein [Parabacteroides faecis]
MSLRDLYHSYNYFVTEESGCLLVGFREDSVTFIVKEIWNKEPLCLADVDGLYAEMQQVGEMCSCNQFRILAHGGYLPEALSFELHGLTVSDESYLKSLESGKHIELFSHNEAAYRAIEEGFQKNRIGAVVQATGTGKSYLIARYIINHLEDTILVIAPNVTIIAEIEKAVGGTMQHVTYRTFQALVLNKADSEQLRADHIIIDEFHHFGAEVWGKAVQDVIDANPEARVLGMSATPIRPEEMLDTVEVYFKGNLFHELSLSMAWYYKILPVPVLVQSVFDLNNQLDKVQQLLNRSDCTSERRQHIQEKIDFARLDFRGSWSASELIRRYLPKEVKKMLVFCKDKEDLKNMIPEVSRWLNQAGLETETFEIHNGQSNRANEKILRNFRQDTGKLHVLFSINMLIEGLHVEGVDAAMFLRRTESYVVALQQLGRCLKAGSNHHPVVLDFVNNLSGRSVYEVMTRDLAYRPAIRAPKTFKGYTEFQVTGFLSDIRAQVDDMLAELDAWPVMYERLVEFKEREGRWPQAAEGKLGNWCNTQRIAYKKGTLSKDYISHLEQIGFEWEVQDSRWMSCFEELKVFMAKEHRCPKRGEHKLNTWCNTQRQARKKGLLSNERIRLLDSIGFWWEQDLDSLWMENWQQVLTYYKKHKRWPKSNEGKAGAWCNTQRKNRKQGLLSAERIALMDAEGFIWTIDDVWMENYGKLQQFFLENNRWPTARENKLGSWCFVQRRALKKGELSPTRKDLLDKIAFPWTLK